LIELAATGCSWAVESVLYRDLKHLANREKAERKNTWPNIISWNDGGMTDNRPDHQREEQRNHHPSD